MRVVIIGAGIAGLTLALLMKRQGFEPELYEAYAKIDALGGFQIAPNGMRVLAALGLDEKVINAGAVSNGMQFYNHTGTLLSEVTHQSAAIYGFPAVNLPRAALISILRSACDEANIPVWYEKPLRAIKQAQPSNPVAIFDDLEREGDLIVGADGINSVVRRSLFPSGPEPADTGLIAFGGFMSASNVPNGVLSEKLSMTFGLSGFFGYGRSSLHSAEQALMWWSTLPHALLKGRRLGDLSLEDIRDVLQEAHQDWHEPIPEIIKNFPHSIQTNIRDIEHLPRWYDGRVLLIGDAAHAVSPHSGQGASMALEDALCLAALFSADGTLSIEEVLQKFQAARRERAEKVVEEGRRSAGNKGELNAFTAWLRDKFVQFLLPALVGRLNEELYRYEIELPATVAPQPVKENFGKNPILVGCHIQNNDNATISSRDENLWPVCGSHSEAAGEPSKLKKADLGGSKK